MKKHYIERIKIGSFFLCFLLGILESVDTKAQSPMASTNVASVNTAIRHTKGMKSLSKILKDFEKHYDINFVYDPSLVEGKYVSENAISYGNSIEQSLNQLLVKYNLRFKKIDTKLFVIQVNDTAVVSSENTSLTKENKLIDFIKEITITGKVLDEKGESLPFANVSVKGKNTGVITDISGNFTINIVDGKEVLVISAIGYLKKEILVGNQSAITVSLLVDIKNLEEVIVVGYTTEKKTDLTGALVVGLYVVLFFVGLQSVPPQYYEAAKMEGATHWQQFWHITIPMINPTIFMIVILSTIGGFSLFIEPYIMTEGGPLNHTLSAVMYIYKQAFQYYHMGYSATLGICFAMLIVGVIMIQKKFIEKEDA